MPGEKIFAFEEVLDAADMTTYFVQQQVVIKIVDESVTSSTTLQDDNELQFAVDANTRYSVEFFLIYNTLAAADLKAQYTVPSGASLTWVSDGIASGTTVTVDTVSRTAQFIGSTPPAHGGVEVSGAPVDMIAFHKGLLTIGATAGTLKLQWAQQASSATATYIRANSTLILTRIS
jgi:hypothetical protein